MGLLRYGGILSVQIPDRELRHLQIVILTKLGRREGFLLHWTDGPGGTGRGAAWMAPGISVSFDYDGEVGQVNREWLERLHAAAGSGSLRLLPEGHQESRPAQHAG